MARTLYYGAGIIRDRGWKVGVPALLDNLRISLERIQGEETIFSEEDFKDLQRFQRRYNLGPPPSHAPPPKPPPSIERR